MEWRQWVLRSNVIWEWLYGLAGAGGILEFVVIGSGCGIIMGFSVGFEWEFGRVRCCGPNWGDNGCCDIKNSHSMGCLSYRVSREFYLEFCGQGLMNDSGI